MAEIKFRWCRFEELSGSEVHALIAVREAVFIVEQNAPYQEADAYDAQSWHLIFSADDEVAAYLRIVDPGVKFVEPSIGRVLTAKNFRGTGLGKRLMEEGVQYSREHYRGLGNRISAQLYLKKFYESFGFEVVSETYLEDGIPHIQMLLNC